MTDNTLARCAALVSNDTGLMHIAAAVHTPMVAVFGPTSPRVYLPRGETAGRDPRMIHLSAKIVV
jgi:heptosyltransferase I